ncbi:hypothetical protein L7F22_053276 [Adiantum nelumboides]|nr:hypothetical protein [Adiantum nelumboides]MCO5599176.1 hypothetical protein [Adiantum nelumboides]
MSASQMYRLTSEGSLPIYHWSSWKPLNSSQLLAHHGLHQERGTAIASADVSIVSGSRSACSSSPSSFSTVPQRQWHINRTLHFLGACREFLPTAASQSHHQNTCRVATPEVGQVEDSAESKEAAELVSDEESSTAKEVKADATQAGVVLMSVHKEGKQQDMKGKQKNQMLNRVVFGTGIGLGMGGAVVAGGWWFTALIATFVYLGTREYFDLVRSDGISDGMTPPPRTVSRACSVICAAMPLMTL